MDNLNFGEVLTRAWQIIWKHKVLWIFGILASCARGGGGGSSGGGNSRYQSGSGESPFSGGQIESFMDKVGTFLQENWWVIAIFVLVILLLSLLSYFLGMMGRIGLIRGTAQADKGAETLTFAELWAESLPFFWRIFGLNFLIGLAFFIIFIPLILFGVLTAGIGFLCIIPLLCVMVPISWAVMAIVEQAQNAIVLEDLTMLDGFKRGWEIAKANVVPILIMMLILGVGSTILGLIIALPVIVAVVPLIVGADKLQQSLTPVYITAACCVVYFPILLAFNGILTAYIQSTWTLTYLRLAPPKAEAPVIIEGNA
jgi:membrane-anchored glycerophosphoryl diester phosphodiesterase (GDPDase)